MASISKSHRDTKHFKKSEYDKRKTFQIKIRVSSVESMEAYNTRLTSIWRDAFIFRYGKILDLLVIQVQKDALIALAQFYDHRIWVVLISQKNCYTPFTARFIFDKNNMTEYEACIMGIKADIDWRIKILEVYGDSMLVIYQVKGEWETCHPKLISYREHVINMMKNLEEITFHHILERKIRRHTFYLHYHINVQSELLQWRTIYKDG